MQRILEVLRIEPGADVTKLARSYAARAKRDGYDRQRIKTDLEAVLQEREPYARHLGALEDFDGQPPARLTETVTQLNRLFNALCRYLAAAGYKIYTPHEKAQIRLKYGVMPKRLELISRPGKHPRYLQPLEENQIAAYYQVLCREQKYFSGEISAFKYYFGTTDHPTAETPPEPLIWAKSTALLAYFAMHLQSRAKGSSEFYDMARFASAFRLRDGSSINAASLKSAASKINKHRRATRGEAELKAALKAVEDAEKHLNTQTVVTT